MLAPGPLRDSIPRTRPSARSRPVTGGDGRIHPQRAGGDKRWAGTSQAERAEGGGSRGLLCGRNTEQRPRVSRRPPPRPPRRPPRRPPPRPPPRPPSPAMTLSDPSHSSCHVAASSAPGAAEEGGQGEHSRRRGAKRRWGKSQKSPGADAEPAALAGPGVQTNHFSESSVRSLFPGFTGWPSAVTSSALRAHRGEERSAHMPEVSLSSPSAAWQSGASPGRAPLRPGGVQDASPRPGPPHRNASGQGQAGHASASDTAPRRRALSAFSSHTWLVAA